MCPPPPVPGGPARPPAPPPPAHTHTRTHTRTHARTHARSLRVLGYQRPSLRRRLSCRPRSAGASQRRRRKSLSRMSALFLTLSLFFTHPRLVFASGQARRFASLSSSLSVFGVIVGAFAAAMGLHVEVHIHALSVRTFLTLTQCYPRACASHGTHGPAATEGDGDAAPACARAHEDGHAHLRTHPAYSIVLT